MKNGKQKKKKGGSKDLSKKINRRTMMELHKLKVKRELKKNPNVKDLTNIRRKLIIVHS